MITIAATVFDLDGFIVIPSHEIDPSSEIDNGARRITRTATLDGNAAVIDTGFTHSDRTLRVTLPNPSRALFDAVAHVTQLYPNVILTISSGAFLAVVEHYSAASGRLDLTIMIISEA